jgi:hypothetical protein
MLKKIEYCEMSYFRDFSSSDEFQPRNRSIENEAPDGMRQELIDLIFYLVENNPSVLSEERIHRVICQSIGVRASGQPYGGMAASIRSNRAALARVLQCWTY